MVFEFELILSYTEKLDMCQLLAILPISQLWGGVKKLRCFF